MPLGPGEQCEGCSRHPFQPYHTDSAVIAGSVMCARCIPSDRTLQRCKACQRIRYCSRACQKEHWPVHKSDCKNAAKSIEYTQSLPWKMAERARTHPKWADKYAALIQSAAAHALKIWENKEASEKSVFVVYLDVHEFVESEERQKIHFQRSIKTAECVPMAKVHAKFDALFAAETQTSAIDGSSLGHYALKGMLAGPNSGVLRIAIVDECPFRLRPAFFEGFPTEFNQGACDVARSQMPPDGDWLKQFKQQIDLHSDHNAWKAPLRQKAFLGWINKQQLHCIRAGIHALDLRKHPNATDTHVFVVFVDCREEIISADQRLSRFFHSVRKAHAIPLHEVEKDHAAALAAAIPTLKAGERLLRILIYDDNSDNDRHNFVSANVYAIPLGVHGRAVPSFDPKWVSTFKEKTRT